MSQGAAVFMTDSAPHPAPEDLQDVPRVCKRNCQDSDLAGAEAPAGQTHRHLPDLHAMQHPRNQELGDSQEAVIVERHPLQRIASVGTVATRVGVEPAGQDQSVDAGKGPAQEKTPCFHTNHLALRVVGTRGNDVKPRPELIQDLRDGRGIIGAVAVRRDKLFPMGGIETGAECRSDAAVGRMPDHLVRDAAHAPGNHIPRPVGRAIVHEDNLQVFGMIKRHPERLQALTELRDAGRFIVTGNQHARPVRCRVHAWSGVYGYRVR